MKKSIFLFFAAILCATSAWAHNLAANQYVYFEKPSDWEAAQLLIGKSNWSEGYTMTKISNTNLYYLKTIKWDGYTEYYFFEKKDKWGGEDKSPTNRTPWTGKTSSKFTSAIAKCHLFNSTKSINSSTTSTTAYATVVNRTQTIKVQLKDGSNWVDATVVPADLTASTYALTSATAAGAKSASLAKESATVSATVDAAYSATVSLSCTNVLDGYMFEGWYDANGNKITSYTVSDAHTVYARFIQSAEETNEVSVTYMCGTTSVATAISETVGVESEKSFTAPTVTGYKFTNWTIGAGIDLKVGTASDATITIVTKSASSDYSLVANYEEVIETIYFINTGKWSVVNLHRWNGTATASAWPGTPLTASGEKIGEYDVYSFTAKQGDFANVIFTNKNTGSDQTADLTWTAGKYYIYNYGTNTGWYTKAEAEALLVTPVVTHDIVVKAVVPEAWTSTTIGIHYWGDGISATSNPVATEKDGNWNKYTIKNVPEGASVNVIFLNGTSWPDDKSKQTANITGITEDKCFQISAKTLDGEGKCTYAVVDCTADIKPEGDVYTIMGAGELGLSWNLGTTGNDMTKQADGTYTLVKEGLDLATTGNYEYKVVKNHSWDWSIPSGNTNQTLKVDKDGTYTITFTLSADKKKLTADAECTAEKEVILDCFVAGTTNLVGGTSDFTDELPMTYDEGTKTYSKTFTALAAGNYQMKVVYGSDWLGYDKLAKPIPANVTEGDDKKIKFSLAEAGDVTVTYNVEKGIGLTGNFADPVIDVYTIMGAGELGLSWDLATTGNDMTKQADGTYTLVKEGLDLATTGNYEYKVVKNHSWDWSIPSGNTNQTLKVDKDGTYTITFTLSADKKKLTADAECTAEKEVILDCFVAGTINLVGGTADFTDKLAMTYDEGTKTYSKTFTALAAGNYQMKVVYGSDWLGYDKLTTPVPANVTKGDDNKIKFSLAEAGNVTVTYNVEDGIGLEGNFAVPAEAKCYLMGIGGDWTTGIEMEEDGDQFKLLCQPIAEGEQFKFKYGDTWTTDVENYDANGVAWVESYPGSGQYNITLPAGNYDFYYKKNENKVWIAAATGCVTEPTPDYTRAVTPGNLGTICLPFNVPAGKASGATFYTLAGKDANGRIAFDEVTTGELEAGKSYLFQANATEIVCFYGTESVLTPDEDGAMKGTFVNMTLTELTDIYYFAKNALWSCVDLTELIVPANCAYVDMGKVTAITEAAPVGVRRITLGVNGAQVATGVDQVQGDNVPTKMIINGQLFILRGEKMYDAQGKLVK